MTFLILSTFIFWPYLVHRPNFRPRAPPEFKANHRNLTFYVSFGPIPECNSAASWIRPLLWKLDTPNIYISNNYMYEPFEIICEKEILVLQNYKNLKEVQKVIDDEILVIPVIQTMNAPQFK